jgi:tripartite-type tricarboxylate transporter receptor subunit TctC
MKLRLTLCAGLIALASSAFGQTYPTKPITFVVPWPAGGNSDFTARVLGTELSKQLGQTVVIENVGGAAGVMGMQRAANSTPDGHTIYFGGTELVVPPMVNKKLQYDWKKQFTPVGQFASVWFVLAAPTDSKYSSMKDMIDYARRNPGKLSYASPGIASTQHMLGESIRERTGAAMTHIPYRGGAQITSDLMGGTIDVGFLTVAGMLANSASGKLKPLAVTSPSRVSQLPNVPALSEIEGLKGFSMGTWQGLFVPAKTPPAVVARLASALEAAVKAPSVRQKLEEAGAVVKFIDGPTFTGYIDSEAQAYRRIVDFAKMTVTE